MTPKSFCVAVSIAVVTLETNAAGMEASRCPDMLTGLKSSIWRDLEVPVCWENSANSYSAEQAWVRDSITQTWQKNSALRFTGWNSCNSSSRGIRIGIGDVNPHVKGLGNRIDGMKEGMMLNFTFNRWSPSCASTKESCIRTIAVHEFGHAIGFAHEQNRDDAPDWCKAEAQGTDGDIKITPFDLHSVMNYCNHQWAGNGKLSDEDIQGLQSWYGKLKDAENRYDGQWKATLAYSDPGCVADQVTLTVSGDTINAKLVTPFNQEVAVTGKMSGEGMMTGIKFVLSEKDTISLFGTMMNGRLHSTDCGCGSYKFTRQ